MRESPKSSTDLFLMTMDPPFWERLVGNDKDSRMIRVVGGGKQKHGLNQASGRG